MMHDAELSVAFFAPKHTALGVGASVTITSSPRPFGRLKPFPQDNMQVTFPNGSDFYETV